MVEQCTECLCNLLPLQQTVLSEAVFLICPLRKKSSKDTNFCFLNVSFCLRLLHYTNLEVFFLFEGFSSSFETSMDNKIPKKLSWKKKRTVRYAVYNTSQLLG